ncbi:hypothetical protein [Amycolatopsis sp. NPDC054798]
MLGAMGEGEGRVPAEELEAAAAAERARALRADIEVQAGLARVAADDAPDGDRPYRRAADRLRGELAAVEARLAELEGRRLWTEWTGALAWGEALHTWFGEDAPAEARPAHGLEPEQAVDTVLVLGVAIQRLAREHGLGGGFPVRRLHPGDLAGVPTGELAAAVAEPGAIAGLWNAGVSLPVCSGPGCSPVSGPSRDMTGGREVVGVRDVQRFSAPALNG